MFKVPACSLGGPIVVAPLSPISEFVPSNLRSAQEGRAHPGVGCGFLGVLDLLTEKRLDLVGETLKKEWMALSWAYGGSRLSGQQKVR